YLEIDREGATVIQMGKYRIVITKPPFSDGFEITAVRPILSRKLEDYDMSKKLRERLDGTAEGIIVCGPPGSGKSTFAAALANYYSSCGKIVKTMESPRDLQVGDEVTQYAPLEGKFELTNDIVLLVRPDYSVYDEMRKSDDFNIYADMRMAGIGLVGVLHANRTIDAVQRFINRIELGMIPQVIDTIIMIRGGEVAEVYSMELKVKVPTGMTEEDLARPVIEVKDFETEKLKYEIYKFGEETVVLPISEEMERRSLSRRIIDEDEVARKLEKLLSGRVKGGFEIEFRGNRVIIGLRRKDIPKIIGKKGGAIKELEKVIGAKIDVRER
ncbi:MAG: ATPase, T2SS/T4P/T4SS family, partial [Candidatus Anstonellales archaeon]